jgi:hypothetical protein
LTNFIELILWLSSKVFWELKFLEGFVKFLELSFGGQQQNLIKLKLN